MLCPCASSPPQPRFRLLHHSEFTQPGAGKEYAGSSASFGMDSLEKLGDSACCLRSSDMSARRIFQVSRLRV